MGRLSELPVEILERITDDLDFGSALWARQSCAKLNWVIRDKFWIVSFTIFNQATKHTHVGFTYPNKKREINFSLDVTTRMLTKKANRVPPTFWVQRASKLGFMFQYLARDSIAGDDLDVLECLHDVPGSEVFMVFQGVNTRPGIAQVANYINGMSIPTKVNVEMVTMKQPLSDSTIWSSGPFVLGENFKSLTLKLTALPLDPAFLKGNGSSRLESLTISQLNRYHAETAPKLFDILALAKSLIVDRLELRELTVWTPSEGGNGKLEVDTLIYDRVSLMPEGTMLNENICIECTARYLIVTTSRNSCWDIVPLLRMFHFPSITTLDLLLTETIPTHVLQHMTDIVTRLDRLFVECTGIGYKGIFQAFSSASHIKSLSVVAELDLEDLHCITKLSRLEFVSLYHGGSFKKEHAQLLAKSCPHLKSLNFFDKCNQNSLTLNHQDLQQLQNDD
ncbi:hypothetical protein TRICI_001631 [Trichomonascus ciferrii]|uniref:F-box domain-containing protein n=1 Tax=Trichomonascus ciferrii TaxID=44093 RepID=A0A642VCH9_9ASCO|nr:hypothetical protein TRICI_001631 [Trichomonascus ciferrii]